MIGIVDVGYKTTDYLTVEIKNKKALPVSGLSGSVEIGVYYLYKAVAEEYERATGGILNVAKAEQVVRNGKTFYRGGK